MNKRKTIKTFEVCGSDYDMGRQIGEQFKPYLDSVMPDVIARVPENISRIAMLEKRLEAQMPGCLQEIYGRADGCGASKDAMLLYMFTELCDGSSAQSNKKSASSLYPSQDGCTTVILKTKDRALFAHNEDAVDFTGDDVALVKYNYKDCFVFAYTMARRMSGSAFALNSHGMVFSSNNIYGGRSNLDNTSRFIALRDIINSKDIAEVRQKLIATNVASPFSLNALDLNTLEISNFEKDLVSVAETPITDVYARSNHFLTKQADFKQNVPASSVFRFEKTAELMSSLNRDSATLTDLINILQYEGDDFDNSVFEDRTKYPGRLCTVATFAIDSSQNTFTVYDRIFNTRFTFDSRANLLSSIPSKP